MSRIMREYIVPRLGVDIVGFYAMLMLLGVLTAKLAINIDLVWALIANYLILVFAFIINDIADRHEDAHTHYYPQTFMDNVRMGLALPLTGDYPSGSKRFTNVFAQGLVSVNVGYLVCITLSLLALGASWLAGGIVSVVVAATLLVVGFMYSHPVTRLKSLPVLDIISHAYLLAAGQILYMVTLPSANTAIWAGIAVVILAFMASVAGDLRNELRDFIADQEAGIRNTTSLIGEKLASRLAVGIHWVAIGGLVVMLGYIILVSR